MLRLASLWIMAACIGCTPGWTPIPRTGEAGSVPAKDQVLVRDYPVAEVETALLATQLFDAARAPKDAAEVVLAELKLPVKRGADGRWRFGESAPAVDVVASGATGGLEHVVMVDADGGRVCDTTLTLAAMAEQVTDTSKERAEEKRGGVVLDHTWVGSLRKGDDTKTACYQVKELLPDPPRRVAVTFSMTGIEALWVPMTSDGKPDATREGVAVWNIFDLYNPDGAGRVARMRLTP